MAKRSSDAHVLKLLAAAFLGLAAIFFGYEAHLSLAAAFPVAAAVFAVMSLKRWPLVEAGLIGLIATSAVSGVWFAFEPRPETMWGVAAAALASLVLVVVMRGEDRERHWYALAPTLLVASWTFYYKFATLGVADESVGRRLVLTLVWLALGVVALVAGKKRSSEALARAGYLFIGVASTKAMVYDTTHLHGMLRVAVLAGAGVLALVGGTIASKLERKDDTTDVSTEAQ